MNALRSTLLQLILVIASLMFPLTAAAQDDATTEAARERFNEGVEYFDNKEYERARLAFVQAYALKPHPAILLNLGQSELRSGHEADAATHFAQYLREHSDATEDQRQAAREGLDRAKKSVGVVTLTVDVSGADVIVDGETVGRSPLDDPLYLSPGEHTLVVEKAGETARKTLTVRAGEELNESLTLSTTPSATPAAPPAGEEEEQEAEEEESVEFAPEDAQRDGRQPFLSWFADTPLAWVGAGLTAASLGSGIILGVTASNYYKSADNVADDIADEVDKPGGVDSTQGVCTLPWGTPDTPYEDDPGFRTACKKYQDRKDTGDDLKLYSTISFVAAGAFAAGTIIYYFVDAPSSDAAEARLRKQREAPKHHFNARLVPALGPGHGGLILQGQF